VNHSALAAAVDQLLLQRGELDLTLLLRHVGALDDNGPRCTRAEARALLNAVQACASAQGCRRAAAPATTVPPEPCV
jgi:hypothetical protein